MEAALSSYHNLTLAQAVVTFSAEPVLVWLSAAIKPTSFSSERRREASSPAAAPPCSQTPL